MPTSASLQTDRARSLILAFAVSRNSSEFCRFLTVVPLRDLKARSAMMVRFELDGSLRLIGHHGLTGNANRAAELQTFEQALALQAISENRVIFAGSAKPDFASERGFMAVPFNEVSPVKGAVCLGFAIDTEMLDLTQVEIELLQLLGELIAVNSLPRMRATGMLSKIYFDSDALDDLAEFTARQLRILDEMAIGKTNVQIARNLNVSESTIKQETVKIFKLLGVSNRQRAVSMGKEMGII